MLSQYVRRTVGHPIATTPLRSLSFTLKPPPQLRLLSTPTRFFHHRAHHSAPPPPTPLAYSKPLRFITPRHTAFRSTRAARDWHQHIDHKTREFYYENIFTGEKTTVQPKVFLPHDATKESSAMAFLRSDRGSVGAHKKKSVLRPVFTAAFIAGTLYALGEFGYLDKLFGYTPPSRTPPLHDRVTERSKEMWIHYEDWVRK